MADIQLLNQYQDHPQDIPSARYQEVSEALYALEQENPTLAAQFRSKFEANPQLMAQFAHFQAARSQWMDTTARFYRRGNERPVSTPREGVVLAGASGDGYRSAAVTEEKKPAETPAVYTVTRGRSDPNQLSLFDDPQRHVDLMLTPAIVNTVYEVLLPIAAERKGSEEYLKKAPATPIEATLELVSDLMQAYEKEGNLDKKEPILKAIGEVVGNLYSSDPGKGLLKNSPPERYTTNREWIVAYYKADALITSDDGQSLVLRAQDFATPLMLSLDRAKTRKVSLQFAGQDNSYLDDLAYLYQMPDIRPLIETLVGAVRGRVDSSVAQATPFYAKGFGVLSWLTHPETRPQDPAYLMSSPISQSLIFITQAARWLYLRNRGFDPKPEMVKAMSGHSQGIMAAVLAAQFLDGEEYVREATKIAVLFFWQGLRMQQMDRDFLDFTPQEAGAAGVDLKKEKPSPMMSIRKITAETLQTYIDQVNKMPPNRKVFISLENTPKGLIVSGPARTLLRLYKLLKETAKTEQKLYADKKLERVPLAVEIDWLQTSAPFHSEYMAGVKSLLREDLRRETDFGEEGIVFDANALKVEVRHTQDGRDLRREADLTSSLITAMSTDRVGYVKVSKGFMDSDLVDIGPGKGVTIFPRLNNEGTNMSAVSAGTAEGLKCLLTTDPKELPEAQDYSRFLSRVAMLPDGSLTLDNTFIGFAHRFPVLIGGMTPTTDNTEMLVYHTNNGYHIEVPGGAMGTADILEAKIREVVKLLNAGETITINLLYLNSYIWGFLNKVKQLVAEGLPISGLTVAAGVPPVDEATRLLRELNDLQMSVVSFKPGDQAGIDAVLKIAEANPDREIIVQLETGPAGGHHSWQPAAIVRDNYGKLRKFKNIILLVGGGIRNQEDAADWFDGSWTGDDVLMPMDGIFLGTRLMTDSRAGTSPAVRQALAATRGIPSNQFLQPGAYGRSGVGTATAGDGEPIHYLKNRAYDVLKAIELKAKPADPNDAPRVNEVIKQNRQAIIEALNGIQKPYFVPIRNGNYDRALTDMTYGEVLERLLELMYFAPEEGKPAAWLDVSWRNFVGRLMSYFENKYRRPGRNGKLAPAFFARTKVLNAALTPPLVDYPELEADPQSVLRRFLDQYPQLRTAKMDSQDVATFGLLSNFGVYSMKPVPFIWKLDETLWTELSRDALWQSHSPRYTADQVYPEPGPVAVAGIAAPYEDGALIMGSMKGGMLVRTLIRELGLTAPTSETIIDVKTPKPAAESNAIYQREMQKYAGQTPARLVDVVTVKADPAGQSTFAVRVYELTAEMAAKLTRVSYEGGPALGQFTAQDLKGFKPEGGATAQRTEYRVADPKAAMAPTEKGKGPSEYAKFMYALASGDTGTLSTLLTSNQIFQGKTPVRNYLRDVMMPREGQRWVIEKDEQGAITRMALYDDKTLGAAAKELPVVELIRLRDKMIGNERADFEVRMRYAEPQPGLGLPRTHALSLYYHYSATQGYAPVHEIMEGRNERIQNFYREFQAADPAEQPHMSVETFNLMRGVFRTPQDLHLRDKDYELTLKVVESQNSVSGKQVRIKGEMVLDDSALPLSFMERATVERFFALLLGLDGDMFQLLHQEAGLTLIERDGKTVLLIDQKVFVRGNYADEPSYRDERLVEQVTLKTEADIAVLKARSWFRPVAGIEFAVGDVVRFVVDVDHRIEKSGNEEKKVLNTTGRIYRGDTLVGHIAIPAANSEHSPQEDPVLLYLHERASEVDRPKGPVPLAEAAVPVEVTTTAPTDMTYYARAFGDLNPIHRSAYFAALANARDPKGPPKGPIAHGLWTYGAVEDQAKLLLANNDSKRVRGLALNFTEIVPLGAKLTISYSHWANQDGNAIYKVKVTIDRDPYTGEEKTVQVADGEITIAPPRRIYVFTGQGSARLNMYHDFAASKAAQSVLDKAEAYFTQTHRFSIKKVVAEGGLIQGEGDAKRHYIYIDGNNKIEAPKGKTVLDMTRFQQPSLAIYADMALAAMDEAGVLPSESLIAGHSLGEYLAIRRLGIFTDEQTWEMVYQRGSLMDEVLKTDPNLRDNSYRMYNVKPHYYQKIEGTNFFNQKTSAFKQNDLEALIAQIMRDHPGVFLQIVNLNVQDQAYAVAGTEAGLKLLEQYLETPDPDMMPKIIKAKGKEKEKGVNELEGIIVPFHSALLLPHVATFRETLQQKLPKQIDASKLIGRYIPNLMGIPFDISEEFVRKVYQYTQTITQTYGHFHNGQDFSSQELQKVLNNYKKYAKDPNGLARILLVELLAYQFASPVQWIATQEVLMKGNGDFAPVEEVIEIGPAAHLSSMWGMTARKLQPFAVPTIVSIATDDGRKAILENRIGMKKAEVSVAAPASATESAVAAGKSAAAAADTPAAAATPQAAVATAPVVAAPANVPPLVAGATKAVEEAKALSVRDAFFAIIALKTGKRYDEIADGKSTIDSLCSGNSTMGNQTVGDLAEEFGLQADEIANPKMIPLTDLLAAIEAKARYKSTGPIVRNAFNEYIVKPLSRWMDRQAIESYLMGERLLPAKRMADVMAWMTGLYSEKFFSVASVAEAKDKLAEAVNRYATSHNLPIPMRSLLEGGGDAGSGVGSKALQKALKEFEEQWFGVKGKLTEGVISLMKQMGIPWQDWMAQKDTERVQALEAMIADLKLKEGEAVWPHLKDYARLTHGIYDADKILEFEWNWGDMRATGLYADLLSGRRLPEDAETADMKTEILRWTTEDLLQVISYFLGTAEGNPYTPNREAIIAVFRDLETKARLILEGKLARGQMPTDKLTAPKTEMTDKGELKLGSQPRLDADGHPIETFADYVAELQASRGQKRGRHSFYPLVSMRNLPTDPRSPGEIVQEKSTSEFLALMQKAAANGFSFTRTVIENGRAVEEPLVFWVSGASEDSIAEALVKFLLAGGAKVVIGHYGSGKRSPMEESPRYEDLRRKYGSAANRLYVLPMNQGNQNDINEAAKWMGSHDLVPDAIIPFGALKTRGTFADNPQGTSAGVHDIMEHGPEWMAQATAALIKERGLAKKAILLAALSGNVNIIGGDMPYGDIKAAMQTLYNSVNSDPSGISQYISVVGARIGMVNTGLTEGVSVLAEILEKKYGVRTSMPIEMAFVLATLLTPEMLAKAQKQHLFLDANSRFEEVPDPAKTLAKEREVLVKEAEAKKALYDQSQKDKKAAGEKTDEEIATEAKAARIQLQPNMRAHLTQFPPKPTADDYARLDTRLGKKGNGPIDLDHTYVVVGMAELGPYMNSRLRWQIESQGEFTIEGAIEMAFRTGRIVFKRERTYVGWWDVKDDQPIAAVEVKEKYEKEMLEQCGSRVVTREEQGFDPKSITAYLQGTVSDDTGMEWRATDEDEAKSIEAKYREEGYDGVAARFDRRLQAWVVHLPKGTRLQALGRYQIDRTVAAQIPTGFDPAQYNIPKDIIEHSDRVVLYDLITTVEALYSAGITDFLAVCALLGIDLDGISDTTGLGLGGMNAMAELEHKDRGVQSEGDRKRDDALQELLINVIKAYSQTRITKGYGPNPTPVTACATAASSVEEAIAILERNPNVHIVIAGGVDDYSATGAIGFENMNATGSAETAAKEGKTPKQMSRPFARDRFGFMESQGAGKLIITRASLALKKRGPEGVTMPIYGIVQMVESSADGAGTSIPEPGAGSRRIAKGGKSEYDLLDGDIRDRFHAMAEVNRELMFEQHLKALREERPTLTDEKLRKLAEEATAMVIRTQQEFWAHRYRMAKEYLEGHNVSQLQAALAQYGLTVDDIAIIYAHGTSTNANDKNEAKLFNDLFKALGRTAGSKAVLVAQKWLTGHPKGAAAAWQMIGAMQAMNFGITSGNRNLGDPDPAFGPLAGSVLYSNQTIEFGPHQLLAALVSSHGFGRVSVMTLLLNPLLLYRKLSEAERAEYFAGRDKAEEIAYQRQNNWMTGAEPFFTFNADKPFEGATDEERRANEAEYLLYPKRFTYDAYKGIFIKTKPTKAAAAASSGGAAAPASLQSAASHSSSSAASTAPLAVTALHAGVQTFAKLEMTQEERLKVMAAYAAAMAMGAKDIADYFDHLMDGDALDPGQETLTHGDLFSLGDDPTAYIAAYPQIAEAYQHMTLQNKYGISRETARMLLAAAQAAKSRHLETLRQILTTPVASPDAPVPGMPLAPVPGTSNVVPMPRR